MTTTAEPPSLLRSIAWLEYLETCRDARRGRYAVGYEQVEVWAWKRLNQRLTAFARAGL